MKACILSVVELKHMVMSSIYTRYFESRGIKYDIIYMDRYHVEEKNNAEQIYRYECPNGGRFSKIIGYFGFVKFAKKIMRKNEYDFVVVWNEYTSAIFANFLRKEYAGRYSLNIRDLYNEESLLQNPKLFNPLLEKSLSKALFATVSSGEYIKHLPKYDKYMFIHSVNKNILPTPKEYPDVVDEIKQIQILYIGKISYYEEAKWMINLLKNDTRFLMKFVGIGSEVLKEYCEDIGCRNVEFVGKFESEKTLSYLREADVIYNIYGDERVCEKTALSNKMYYAACLNVPILVCKNTYMNTVASRCGIAFAVDECEPTELGNRLFDWYIKLDRKEIQNKCSDFINEAIDSQEMLYKYLDKEFKVEMENEK